MGRRHGTLTLRREDGRIVTERVKLADTWPRRMAGLLGRSSVGHDEGVVLRPAFSIHTFFMRFPIDAVFLDYDLVVLRIASPLRPFRTASCRGAREVVEIRAGECERRGLRGACEIRCECSRAQRGAQPGGASEVRRSSQRLERHVRSRDRLRPSGPVLRPHRATELGRGYPNDSPHERRRASFAWPDWCWLYSSRADALGEQYVGAFGDRTVRQGCGCPSQ